MTEVFSKNNASVKLYAVSYNLPAMENILSYKYKCPLPSYISP